MPKTTFTHGIKMAIEASRGDTPPLGGWWEGRRWFGVVTTALTDVMGRQATIFPSGYAGKRAMNSQPPVVGRRWAEGGIDANFVPDFAGLVLYGVLGTGSTNSVPSTTGTLLATESWAGKSQVLSSQPSDGGAILEFAFSSVTGSGAITVQGIDVYGNGASETITFTTGAGSVYTRTSYSAIGASSIVFAAGTDGGTVSIYGYKYWEHLFSVNETTNPTFSMERIGDPQAGAASISFLHDGLVITEATIESPAEDREGLITINAGFEGNFPTTITSTTIHEASAMRIWPAWTLTVTKNSGSYCKVTNSTFTINSGARNYRAACGTQNPQGSFFGGMEVTGSHEILVDTEEEYKTWLGASKMALSLIWVTPWKLTSTAFMQLSASIPNAYVDSEPGLGDSDDAFTLSQDFRSVFEGTNNLIQFTLRNTVPGNAYNL